MIVRGNDGRTYREVIGVRIERVNCDSAYGDIFHLQLYVGGAHVTVMSASGQSTPDDLVVLQERISEKLINDPSAVIDLRSLRKKNKSCVSSRQPPS